MKRTLSLTAQWIVTLFWLRNKRTRYVLNNDTGNQGNVINKGNYTGQ